MKHLRNRFERFCQINRHKGIPNLMLYITIGSAIVYLLSMFDRSYILYSALSFDRAKILQGQIWRLFTYAFTYDAGNILLTAVVLFCYYSLGRAMEAVWGTLRFNLFYLSGILMMDIFCLLFGGAASITYLNMSLFLAYATMYPDAQFLFMFFIPVKAWIFALVDLGLTLYAFITLAAAGYFPYCLYPFVAIGNYFLFFGKDVLNVIPHAWRIKIARIFKRTPHAQSQRPIEFRQCQPQQKAPYTHRCTICGRTDVSHPDLEFRYCSKCNGYFCYCEDHINHHSHIK